MRTRFHQFTMDTDARQLLHEEEEVHLSPKAFDLLCLLLARRPNVVAKEELLRQLWPGTFVLEANLNVLVGEIRRAIADSSQKPKFIRTVHGVGYAFCGAAVDIEKPARKEQQNPTRYWLAGTDRNFVLSEGGNVIGRDPSCTVWLDDPDVSRRHARIHIDSDAETAVLDDLNSTNGTWVGNARVKVQTTLVDGAVIRVGPIELRFRDGAAKPQETRRIRRQRR